MKKLYFKQWTIGWAKGDIGQILKSGSFDKEVYWLKPESPGHFQADPFPVQSSDGLSIIYEDFDIEANYGNISVMNLDENLNVLNRRILLDTGSHLSFPFIFAGESKMFVFPESVKTGNVCCYEYDHVSQSLNYISELVKMPLYDPVVLKKDGRYWLFGSVFENRKDYKLHIFYSENMAGPYTRLKNNPVKSGLNGTRAAGGFIETADGLFRPTQNCLNEYGESITINRVTRLNETGFSEEPVMIIKAGEREIRENGIHNIHTINVLGNLIILDGMKWTFSLREQFKNYRRNRRLLRESLLNESQKQE
jgi:hypothetical protein